MTTYPNQKIISRFVYEKADGENHYACINLEVMQVAMLDLKPTSFKLWCYLSKNKRDYKNMALSCADCAKWGIKKTAYYDAVKELEEKGYLITQGGNKYVFHQMPIEVPENGK